MLLFSYLWIPLIEEKACIVCDGRQREFEVNRGQILNILSTQYFKLGMIHSFHIQQVGALY